MTNTLPLSTIRLVFAPEEFAAKPDLVISWAYELVDIGFGSEVLYDLVSTDPNEWERVARLLPEVAREAGIDLANDDALRDLAIQLISTHLASPSDRGGRTVLDAMAEVGVGAFGGWRETIAGYFCNLGYAADDLAFSWRPSNLTAWVTDHWRDLIAKQGWPQSG